MLLQQHTLPETYHNISASQPVSPVTITASSVGPTMIPPASNMKAKTNFSIDWIVKNDKTETATKLGFPKEYDTEMFKALRLPITPPLETSSKSDSPSGSPQHQTMLQPTTHLPHPPHQHQPFIAIDESSFERTSPISLNEVSPPIIHHPQNSPPISHPTHLHPSQVLHHPHQRPAPYRPIPYQHGMNYGASHHPQHIPSGPGAPNVASGPGPIRTGQSAGGMSDNDLMIAQMHFIATMSLRQQQHHQQQQLATMQQAVGQPQLPIGHPAAGQLPMINPMFSHPAQHFHGDATVAYPLAPWLMRGNARLMPRYPHEIYMQAFRKQKRVRTAFAPLQLLKLEHAFEDNQYVVGTERKQLAKNLNLSETQVKVWFQNRRTKHKRMSQEEGGSNASADDKSSGRDNSLEDIDLEDDCCDDDEDDVISVLS